MRCQQRNYRDDEIDFVMCFGTRVYGGGTLMYFLRRKDIPRDLWDKWAERLVNTAVLLDDRTQTILTVYRNPNALRDHRRKTKYDRAG